MRRVLIVSPHFCPVNAPDMQRARLALPYLRNLGWEPVVLAVSPESIEGPVVEPLLEQTYPADIRVVRVRGISPRLTRPFGFGSLWLRCGRALRRAGDRLLAREKFDLVFFTTTQFDAFALGPRWLRRHGVPYVLDYQDPWVNDHYAHAGLRPPGGPLRYWLSQYTARRREPSAVHKASAIVAVSSHYGPDLLRRYPGLSARKIHLIPFSASVTDWEIARAHVPSRPLVSWNGDFIHLVYAGRCTEGMTRALRILFGALRDLHSKSPALAALLRLHFIGTDYAPPSLARPTVLPIAREEGVVDQVTEHPVRVPYFEALHYLAHANAILVIGSDDPAYNASKIHPCLLANRPLLCIAHKDGPIYDAARLHIPLSAFGFGEQASDANLARTISHDWLSGLPAMPSPCLDHDLLAPHSAREMTRRLASVFDNAILRSP